MVEANAGRSLLVFADDWGRHPSSCQHLVQRLLNHWNVVWVNTIMRPPGFDRTTLERGLQKLRQWSRRSSPSGSLTTGPRVLNPRMWPWLRTAFERGLNCRLLCSQLLPIVRSLPSPPVALTTLPIVADLLGRLPVERWVYYCVDDFTAWPGLDGPALGRLEELLIDKADAVLAVSDTLREKLARRGRDATLLTHGVDLAHWEPKADPITLPLLLKLPQPLVVFWGVIDQRMDVTFLERLGRDMTGGTILLVGPQNEPSSKLQRLERVVCHPPVPFEHLPAVARAAGVLIMPYADLPVTRAIQPLKLKEYLATGKPTVVRDLPANRPWADCLDLAQDEVSFSELVRLRLRTGLPPGQQAARHRLVSESWAVKAAALEEVLLGRPPSKGPH